MQLISDKYVHRSRLNHHPRSSGGEGEISKLCCFDESEWPDSPYFTLPNPGEIPAWSANRRGPVSQRFVILSRSSIRSRALSAPGIRRQGQFDHPVKSRLREIVNQ